MSDYTRNVLRVVVAQICQTIGWHSINPSPLELLVDLMQEYLMRTYRLSHEYAEVYGRTEINLDDVGLAFQQMSIDINELADYVRNVDPVPCAVPVPKYPLPLVENHLNFLKPGSREVITRPVNIHEHLPPMYPEIEELPDENTPDNSIIECKTICSNNLSPLKQSNDISSEGIFKRPGDPLSDSPNFKRPRINDESRPLREIHSVMMTTSGFLSPAREGKLPEARTPIQARPDTPPPPPSPPPSSSTLTISKLPPPTQSNLKSQIPIAPVSSLPSSSSSSSLSITQNSTINDTIGLPPNLIIPPDIKIEKKSKKIMKKSLEDRKLDKENKKKNRDKDLFKPDKIITEPKVKKLTTTKDSSKLKNIKTACTIKEIDSSQSSSIIPPINISNNDDNLKIIKNSTTIKEKKDKNVTINDKKHDDIVKLSSEPDKQKLNIFKKISKSKDDSKSIDIIDNHKNKDNNTSCIDNNNIRNDIEIKKEEKLKVPRTPDINMHNDNDTVDLRSPSSDVYSFPDMSPPGTPSTPKTPELNVPGPADIKKKKKETRGRKKTIFKSPVFNNSPQKAKIPHDMMETNYLGRPKTPEAPDTLTRKDMNVHPTLPFPYFPNYPAGPGLIPHHISHTMFSRFPMPPGPRGIPNLPPQSMTPHFLPPPTPLPPIKVENNSIPKINNSESSYINNINDTTINNHHITTKNDIRIDKITKTVKQEKSPINKASTSKIDSYVPGVVAQQPVDNIKFEKTEKLDKKSKKHKLEKKEKLKKKKDKKDKHKEKSDKIKEKKEKLEKIKDKKEKKEKKKDIIIKKEEKEVESIPKLTLKLGPSSPRPSTPDNPMIKKLTIKPLLKKPEDVKRESSPELAKISALVTRPPKQKPPKIKKEVVKKEDPIELTSQGFLQQPCPSMIINKDGQQIWICPECGKQDDGSPMIGCDGCDAWYHWVCIDMEVPPEENVNWYCRFCLSKQQDPCHDKKKKKRKKKEKIPE